MQLRYTGKVSPHRPVRSRCCRLRQLLIATPSSHSSPRPRALIPRLPPLQKSFTIIYLYLLLARALAEPALGFSAVEEPGGAPGGRPDPAPRGVRAGLGAGTHGAAAGAWAPSPTFSLLFFHSFFLAFSFLLRKKRSPSASKEINPIYYLSLSKCVSSARDARRIHNSWLREN